MNLATGTVISQLPTGTIDSLLDVFPLSINPTGTQQTIQASLLQAVQYLQANVLNGAYQPSGTNGKVMLYDGTILSATGAIVVYPQGSIPQNFRKLEMEISVRTNRANTFDGVFFKANGDNGSNYTSFLLWHNFDSQSNDQSAAQAPTGTFAFATAANAPANVFGFYLVSFPYYADTGRRKDFQSRGGQMIGTGTTQMFIYDAVGNWNSLAGITGLVLYSDTGNSFVSGTRWTLWGLR